MRYFSQIACVLFLIAVVFAAGCIETNTPGTPTPTPASNPLAGDPVVGVWTASEQVTQSDSGTGKTTEITTDYTITILSDGSCTVVSDCNKKKGFSSVSNLVSTDGTVSKNENVYTIEAQLQRKFVVTLSADGSAVLTTPDGSELPLQKSEV
ncbi:hypothetical protein O0S10_02575 [Methanocorpusculum sp. MG]|uniref:Lipocalin-like domain-containing protein n=1 Tax=Methanocorpusculum petauri TaxID=3002863 RepID=A0ABT4IEE6_9EURY|nr:hypothetical protein [Methanocorpusculum petauri]MCZ0860114.1 hypothetical protein [Methanocorpusculum petauri]